MATINISNRLFFSTSENTRGFSVCGAVLVTLIATHANTHSRNR